VANADPALNGCPPPQTQAIPDRDHDGIPDSVDACPDVPGVASKDPKLNGCPPPDRDHDGIPDAVDACPDVPGVISDDPKKNGCPKDTDSDGVPDAEDNCPTVPGPASNHGCPLAQPQLVALRANKLEILQKVFFKTNMAVIEKRSFELLNQVAEVLQSHPDIKLVQVEGHTDTVGTPEKNMRLSQKRADAVRAYLVKRGVDGDRLVAKGFGQEKPVETNETEEGRSANRRVEFNIVQSQQGPDAAEPAAPKTEPVPEPASSPIPEAAPTPAAPGKPEPTPAVSARPEAAPTPAVSSKPETTPAPEDAAKPEDAPKHTVTPKPDATPEPADPEP
jgi:outer membrane protein OmpA-like peptidoglycan-associated protein